MHSRAERDTAGTLASTEVPLLALCAAIALGAAFIALALPYLDTLAHDTDEASLMLDARLIALGRRPYIDFPHHEMPLQLYLLTAAGKVFGQTVFGYRMLSLLAVAASGVVLFALAVPFVGTLSALMAEVVFLFSPVQMRALTAVPETATVLFTLIGALCLFVGRTRWSAYAAGLAFVLALMTKPTAIVMVVAAVVSLVLARDWRRLRDFAAVGVVAAGIGLAWVNHVSDGVFMEIMRFQITRVGTRNVGMWTFDSGFTDMLKIAGIDRPWQFTLSSFKTFHQYGVEYGPMMVFVLAMLALPVWVFGCARSRPALRAFVVLWPASYLVANFVAIDFVTPRYFIPFQAFSAFLVAGLVWLARRRLPAAAITAAGAALGIALGAHFASALASNRDLWYWGRTDWIARNHAPVVSFSPLFFAATGTEPGCEFANPALTYGVFGETFLATPRTRGFRFSDERLIQCLRAHPDTPVVVDWSFYFFTRPGSPLRQYLSSEGSAQRLFFSPDAVEQWDRPLLHMNPFR